MDNKVNEFLAIKGLKNRLKWINDNLEDTQLLAILKIVKLKLNATVHGNTLLYIAIKNHGDDSLPGNNNNLKAITLLINAGADPNIHAGLSPLMMTQISPQGWATQRPDNTIITQLLIDAGANINAKNISTALYFALQYHNIDSINGICQYIDNLQNKKLVMYGPAGDREDLVIKTITCLFLETNAFSWLLLLAYLLF